MLPGAPKGKLNFSGPECGVRCVSVIHGALGWGRLDLPVGCGVPLLDGLATELRGCRLALGKRWNNLGLKPHALYTAPARLAPIQPSRAASIITPCVDLDIPFRPSVTLVVRHRADVRRRRALRYPVRLMEYYRERGRTTLLESRADGSSCGGLGTTQRAMILLRASARLPGRATSLRASDNRRLSIAWADLGIPSWQNTFSSQLRLQFGLRFCRSPTPTTVAGSVRR